MTKLKECLICGGELNKFVKSNLYNYYKCIKCNVAQLNPMPTTNELDNFYKTYHLNDEEGGSYDWIEERMKADFPSKIKIIKKYSSHDNLKLLDIGCGKGFFIKECSSKNIIAKGIDVSESGINYAVKILQVNALQIDIIKFSERIEENNKYDIITLWATIEHLPNPKQVFKSIYLCLKPGGLLFIDTGLGNDHSEKMLPGHSQWYDAPQHLFVYSIEGLCKLLTVSNFETLAINKNFERSSVRKIIKFIRHFIICYFSFLLLRPVLGKPGFVSMQMESKWPVGKLLQIIARKINE